MECLDKVLSNCGRLTIAILLLTSIPHSSSSISPASDNRLPQYSSFDHSKITIDIKCKYFKEFRTYIGEVPVCFVLDRQSILEDETYIGSVTDGNRTLSKDHRIKHFATLDKFYHFMPQGLNEVFGKLHGLEFVQSKLKVLRQKDMRPHTDLVYLNLRGNDIECIDGDVFSANSKLKFISLADNKIRRIDVKIFGSLVNVQQFYLNGNFCYSQKANSRYDIEFMKESLKSSCAPLYLEAGIPLKCETLVEMEKENVRRLNQELEKEKRKYLELEEEHKNAKNVEF